MKILVIRFYHIGDVLLTSVLCSSLRRSFPDAEIDYLMQEKAAPLFEHHPDIDRVIALSDRQRKNPVRYFQTILKIRAARYDVIIDASSSGKSELISLFSRRSAFRIGRAKKGRGRGYTHGIEKTLLNGDKISQRLALLSPLQDAGHQISVVDQMKLAVTADEVTLMQDRMRTAGVDLKRPIFALATSSREPHKKWSNERMLALAQHCLDKHKAQLILVAGLAHERADAVDFHKQLVNHKDVFSNIATNDLRELSAMLSLCGFYLGNEGGPRHIAHAHGLPSVVVVSPSGRKAEWLPNDPRHRGIEWQDLNQQLDANAFSQGKQFDTEQYRDLYDLITLDAVVSQVDQVVATYL